MKELAIWKYDNEISKSCTWHWDKSYPSTDSVKLVNWIKIKELKIISHLKADRHQIAEYINSPLVFLCTHYAQSLKC